MILTPPREGLVIVTDKRYAKKSQAIAPLYINGEKYCAWCGKIEISSVCKYCSDLCKNSSDIYCNPHSLTARGYYLHSQNYKCFDCGHDYIPVLTELGEFRHIDYTVIQDNLYFMYHAYRMISLKTQDSGHRPEIHHIEAIYLGGNGVGNGMVILCQECHKKRHAKKPKLKKEDFPSETCLYVTDLNEKKEFKKI
jgi:5-methylcytosine-specific restriction endonuclease McrA